jgi:hypothetical protein
MILWRVFQEGTLTRQYTKTYKQVFMGLVGFLKVGALCSAWDIGEISGLA